MVKRLEKNGELSKEIVFIDGTKLEACANKYTFVWKKSVGKWEAKMYGRIQGSSQPSEAGVHLRFPCCRGKTYSGFAEDLPFPGGEVQNGWDSFRTWKRETQKQESKISGTVSTLPGTPDSL